MLSAHRNQPYESRREVLIKEEPLDHFDIQARSTTYWPKPNMSAVQSPVEFCARDLDTSETQSRTYLPPPADSAAYMHEDHADVNVATKRDPGGRPKRKRIAPQQLDALFGLFQQTDTPSYEQRERVAVQLGMSNREVQVWFQNRRAKERNVKQKQQLMAHRERLERAESASNASGSTPMLQFAPDLPAAHAPSSPAQAISDRIPQAFNPNRRRSLSTSALDFPPSTAFNLPMSTSPQSHSDAHHPLPFGPMRPRFNRHHTNFSQYAFGRPSSARSEMPLSRSPPSRLRHLTHTGTELTIEATSAEELANHRRELMLPLPQPRYRFEHSSTSSFNMSRPSSSSSGTIADRRENRLPPIRMLLDIADGALADQSPSISGMPSSQSCSLYSPFSDLQLNTPGSQDGRRMDYFSARQSQPEISRGDGEPVASPQYTFGSNYL